MIALYTRGKIRRYAACLIKGRFLISALITAVVLIHTPVCVEASDDANNTCKAGSIINITQKHTDYGIIITITGNNRLKDYRANVVHNPYRLILDIYGAVFDTGPYSYSLSSAPVSRVKVDRTNRDRTRLVFYMRKPSGTTYKISPEGNKLQVSFYTALGADTIPRATIDAPSGDITITRGDHIEFRGSVKGGNVPLTTQWIVYGNSLRQTVKDKPFRFYKTGIYDITYLVTDRDGDISSDTLKVKVVDDHSAGKAPTAREITADRDKETASASSNNGLFDGSVRASLKTGVYHAGKVNEFIVSHNGSTAEDIWSLTKKNAAVLAVHPSYRINPYLKIDLGIEKMIFDNKTAILFASIGSTLIHPGTENITPHLRLGLVYGDMHCGDVPGRFRTGYGSELGYGIQFNWSHLEAGLDILYRNIAFEYDPPANTNIVYTKDKIELSGCAFSGIIAYRF